jgi:hypothetical protein
MEFHLGLMLFGWGFWFWSVPMLALLVTQLRYDFANAMRPRGFNFRAVTGPEGDCSAPADGKRVR